MHDVALMPFASPCADSPCADSSSTTTNLLNRFDDGFIAKLADTPEMVRTAQAIRYQVYCLERKFENAAEHDDQLERDMFDDAAVHSLVIHRRTMTAIGTARLLLPQYASGNMPIRRLLRQSDLEAGKYFPIDTTAEVSRFSISNDFRRRCEKELADRHPQRAKETCGILPCLGLLQDLLRQSITLGLTHWAAVMEPKLLRMLASLGVHTTPIGPLVSYHGLRQPCYCNLSEMLGRLHREQPENWRVITDGGKLMPGDVTQFRLADRCAA